MWFCLILPALCISKSCIKIKINFLFSLLCGASKSFMKAFKAFINPFDAPEKAFIKPFEAPKKIVKVKSKVNFLIFVAGRVKCQSFDQVFHTGL